MTIKNTLAVISNENINTDAKAVRQSALIDSLHVQLDALGEHADLVNDFSHEITIGRLHRFVSVVNFAIERMIQDINKEQEM